MMVDAFDVSRQVNWEVEGHRLAAERWRAAASSKTPDQLPGGQRLLREIVPPTSARIAEQQAILGREAGPHVWPLQAVEPDVLAVIACTTCLRLAAGAVTCWVTTLAGEVAAAVRAEIEYERWADAEGADVVARLRRRHPDLNVRTWQRLRKRVLELRREAWPTALSVQVGSALIAAVVEAAPQHFQRVLLYDRGRPRAAVTVGGPASELMRDINTRAELARPLRMPMVIPPLDWRYDADGRAEGAFYLIREPLIRAATHKHTSVLDRPVSEADLSALNAVQRTPWRVNGWLLDVACEAWRDDRPIAGLEKALACALPDRIDPDIWAAMDDAERKAHRERRAALHSANATAVGHAWASINGLAIATALRDQNEIYYPHSRDWRGRIYPLAAAGPHPQGDDLSKALIMFASGLPLGPDGEFWLCVRAANHWGCDKLPLAERVAWTLGAAEDIGWSAVDPMVHTWWADAEEPWQFLATCRELAMAWALPDPAEFVSHLPVQMDGTCNGLQHLAAMGRDPVGAKATNLTPDPERHDIYQDVADHVAAAVAEDDAVGVAEALRWHGHVTRKTTKRAVMTTPYGVTAAGISRQLILDGNVPEGEGSPRAAADYLRDRLTAALAATVVSAQEIMTWLQAVAERLAAAGLPFEWTTPTGSRCRQAYATVAITQVVTLCGRLALAVTVDDAVVPARKQAAGAAPNFIHSMDAAHLSMTVNAAATEGVRSFSMVHDSYGTHARNTTALAAILRAEFVSLYRTDWLAEVAREVRATAPHVALPARPARGTFDVAEVLHAPFFFS